MLFDNERGKGDHAHIRDVETLYELIDIEALEADFRAAVRADQAAEEA